MIHLLLRPVPRTWARCTVASLYRTPQLYLLSALWPQASFLTSLCLGFSSIKWQQHLYVLHCVMENFKGDQTYKALRMVPNICSLFFLFRKIMYHINIITTKFSFSCIWLHEQSPSLSTSSILWILFFLLTSSYQDFPRITAAKWGSSPTSLPQPLPSGRESLRQYLQPRLLF